MSEKAESRSFSLGLFCKMNMDSVIRRGISWRTLATIWKSLRFMPELHSSIRDHALLPVSVAVDMRVLGVVNLNF